MLPQNSEKPHVLFALYFLLQFQELLKMGDSMFQDQWFRCGSNMEDKDHSLCMITEGNQDRCETYNNNSPSSSSVVESTISNTSCSSSLEIMDDASSSTSCTSSLYDLSTLMAQLPIKRGLSKYYEGKSESFTSLARVTIVEDLPKKGTPYSRKMKGCKSYGAGLDPYYKSYTLPKATILKKASRRSFLSSCYNRNANSTISRSRPPLIPVQRT